MLRIVVDDVPHKSLKSKVVTYFSGTLEISLKAGLYTPSCFVYRRDSMGEIVDVTDHFSDEEVVRVLFRHVIASSCQWLQVPEEVSPAA